MEHSVEDDLLLRDQPSPAPKPKLRRLKKASESGQRDPPKAHPDSYPSPEDALETPTIMMMPPSEEAMPKVVVPVTGSGEIGAEIAEETEFNPLFPDLAQRDPKGQDIRIEEGFGWERGTASAAPEEINTGFENARSAKKRLILEEGGETTEKSKKSKTGEKHKEPLREKRRVEKERKAELVQIHAESQRLLRETRDVSFKPIPLVQKPISSVLDKIRLRKLEVLKKSSISNHSESVNGTGNEKTNVHYGVDFSMLDSRSEDDAGSKENKFPHGEEPIGVEDGSILSKRDNDHDSQAFVPKFDDANQPREIDKENAVDDCNYIGENNQLVNSTKDASEDISTVLPSLSSKYISMDVNASSSSLEDNDEENNIPRLHRAVNIDSYSVDKNVKAFVDDEAEEEDDSDNDLMRFQENEEDESDDNEEVNDIIATDFQEAPKDYERRNQLHQKWLEQQDTDATDNVLQRLTRHQKQKEHILFHENENGEFSEHSEEEGTEDEGNEDEESNDLQPISIIRKNTKMAKQMIAKMFSEDHDAYLPSDDEETEQTLIRQRLQKHNEDSKFVAMADDAHSREVFGLIKKINIAPDSKKRPKPTSNFNMILTRGSNISCSKSSFLGRATSCSMQSSHKQGGSTTLRAYIFGRDDSNSRNSLSTSDNLQDMEHKQNPRTKASARISGSQQEHKQNPRTKASARISGSQMNATVSKAKTEDTNSSSSLFEILQQSITCFDKQTENKTRTDNVKQTETAGQFSAFKIARKFSKVQTRS